MLRLLSLAFLLCASVAYATDKPSPNPLSQAQSQTQSQTQAQTVNAGGGQGGGASNSFTEKSSTIAVATGAPIPAVCPAGLVPGKGKLRGWQVVGLWAQSALCAAPDESQAAAMQVIRDHELALARIAVDAARADAERDRAAAERIRTETQCVTCQIAK